MRWQGAWRGIERKRRGGEGDVKVVDCGVWWQGGTAGYLLHVGPQLPGVALAEGGRARALRQRFLQQVGGGEGNDKEG